MMEYVLLVGMLAQQGYGTSNHAVAVLSDLRPTHAHVQVEFSPLHKVDTQDGWQLRLDAAPTIGSSVYVQPGVVAYYQHTSQYAKWLVGARTRIGVHRYGWDAYGLLDVGLTDNMAKFAVGGGIIARCGGGFTMFGEMIVGPTNHGTRELQIRSMAGWSW